MIIIDDTLISDEVYTEYFVCDQPKCLGGCCVHGDAGAPLEEEEAKILDKIYPFVKPYLRFEGIQEIETFGKSVMDIDGEYTTPLIKGKECAYVFFDDKNTAKCGIEKAWEEKRVDFKKPVSCHLYPIRITKYSNYEAVNNHRWPICEPALKVGKKLNVRMYEFLKESLIRQYGEAWYTQLDEYVKSTLGEKKHVTPNV